MSFWNSNTLRVRVPRENIVSPFDSGRIAHAAYEMGVGSEAYVSSTATAKTQLDEGVKVIIPPGQFALLVTSETVTIPTNVIAFISIRASIKFEGLVNVSGFHVDPGFSGRLKFAVYNASSHTVFLDQGQRVFMIWFADLDGPDDNPYTKKQGPAPIISSKDVKGIEGDVASPAMLRAEIEALKTEWEKKFHAAEQTRLWNRALLMLLIGISVTVALTIAKPYLAHPAAAGVATIDSASGTGKASKARETSNPLPKTP